MDLELQKSLMISAAGLKAQSTRMRVIAENLANQDSVASEPGGDPYRRKTVTFKNALDRELGIERVAVNKVDFDRSEFGKKYEPGHPAADDQGYVKTTNVAGLIEAMDMKEAQRSYQANLNAVEAVKSLTLRTLELLR